MWKKEFYTYVGSAEERRAVLGVSWGRLVGGRGRGVENECKFAVELSTFSWIASGESGRGWNVRGPFARGPRGRNPCEGSRCVRLEAPSVPLGR